MIKVLLEFIIPMKNLSEKATIQIDQVLKRSRAEISLTMRCIIKWKRKDNVSKTQLFVKAFKNKETLKFRN